MGVGEIIDSSCHSVFSSCANTCIASVATSILPVLSARIERADLQNQSVSMFICSGEGRLSGFWGESTSDTTLSTSRATLLHCTKGDNYNNNAMSTSVTGFGATGYVSVFDDRQLVTGVPWTVFKGLWRTQNSTVNAKRRTIYTSSNPLVE